VISVLNLEIQQKVSYFINTPCLLLTIFPEKRMEVNPWCQVLADLSDFQSVYKYIRQDVRKTIKK
jgi:hypothetical protein